MSDVQSILDVLAAGGDTAIMVVAYMLWRLERRVLALEFLVEKTKKVKR